jgi:VIT1/CCC1 family predicted Fe2+/Mn2+ transporter
VLRSAVSVGNDERQHDHPLRVMTPASDPHPLSDLAGRAERKSSRRVLDPADRIAEVLFGVIMVLTFTGSLSVAEAGREDIRTMLVGALGCNLAWGIIDGILYLMGSLAQKGHALKTYLAVRRSRDSEEARQLIADALPPLIASVLEPVEVERLRERLQALPDPPRARLSRADWVAACGVFLLVFLSTFPVAIPFVFMHNASAAMRASNVVAIGMLLIAGTAYGRLVGRSPWLAGISMVALGAVLVALTIALGG